MKTMKNFAKTANKKIDATAKKMGFNACERRKIKKVVKNFGYDVGVQVVSTLIIDGVSTVAYAAGHGVAMAFNGVCSATKAGASAVKSGAETLKNKADSKKAAKKAAREEAEEILEESIDSEEFEEVPTPQGEEQGASEDGQDAEEESENLDGEEEPEQPATEETPQPNNEKAGNKASKRSKK